MVLQLVRALQLGLAIERLAERGGGENQAGNGRGTGRAEVAVTAGCLYHRARALMRQGKLEETLVDARLLEQLAIDSGLEYYRARAGVIVSDVKGRLGDMLSAIYACSETHDKRFSVDGINYGLDERFDKF